MRVCLLCWWACADLLEMEAHPGVVSKSETDTPTAPEVVGRGKKEGRETAPLAVVAGDVEEGEGLARTVGDALALLEGVLRSAPAEGAKRAA